MKRTTWRARRGVHETGFKRQEKRTEKRRVNAPFLTSRSASADNWHKPANKAGGEKNQKIKSEIKEGKDRN